MNIEELYAKLDSGMLFHIALHDDENKEIASGYSKGNIFYTDLTKDEIKFDSFAEIVNHMEENFSSGVKRFTTEIALQNSLVETRFDSSDGIAHFHQWGPNPEPIRAEKATLFSLAKLLAKTLNIELPGPILSVTKISELQLG